MELRRATKKIPSEQNLRVLSSLIISLANKVDSTSEKCINPFTPNTAYAKGSYVTHDNYIYESKLACNDANWVESHWVRLSDTIEELTVNDVKNFLSLTQDQLDTLASIISTEVRLDKCFSSSDTYTRIQDALKEAKQYCITELAKKSTGSFKKANDTTEVTDGNYLYLILNPSTSKYDIYALVDSNVELLTSVDVNLDNYYTKTETEADYLKKTDATSTYATITTVDTHIADTDVHVTKELKDKLGTIPTDDEIKALIRNNENKVTLHHVGTESVFDFIDTNCTEGYRTYWIKFESTATDTPCDYGYCKVIVDSPHWIKVIAYDVVSKNNYITMKENGVWNKTWTKTLTNTDITTTINHLSTDTQVPSAKASYDITKYNIIGLECPVDKSPLEFALENTVQNKIVYFTSWGNSTSDAGDSFSTYIAIRHQDDRYVALFCIPAYGKTKINNYQKSTWTGWQGVCTTSVADVPKTAITFTDETNHKIITADETYYIVKNGTCFVSLVFNTVTADATTRIQNLPIPLAKSTINTQALQYNYKDVTNVRARVSLTGSGMLDITGGNVGTTYTCYFSYPVAEN